MPMDEDDETPLLEEDLDGESPMPPRRAKMPTIGDDEDNAAGSAALGAAAV